MRLKEAREQLIKFRDENRIRHDWHEPDEQGVSAIVTGVKLDNAFGTFQPGGCTYYQELMVHLEKDGKLALSLNLADILALATNAGVGA